MVGPPDSDEARRPGRLVAGIMGWYGRGESWAASLTGFRRVSGGKLASERLAANCSPAMRQQIDRLRTALDESQAQIE